jgi:DNA-binding response OmpR family regulator
MAKFKIIIIEDEDVLAQMYAGKLRREGYDVITAPDGTTGLSEALRERPDIILLDIMMPNMNGVEVLTRLTQHPELADTKIVVLTNTDSPETGEEVRKLGAIDYILKANMTPEELCERVKKYLHQGQT